MRLAIFDLDNTILEGDSDHAWGEFIIERGLVSDAEHRQKNDAFYDQYVKGELDIFAYQRFVLNPLKGMSLTDIQPLQQAFLQEKIIPIIKQKALDLIEDHRQKNDFILIITATNHLITAPIAQYLNVHDLIATTPTVIENIISGEASGTPSFREGKVARLHEWLQNKDHAFSLHESFFYSDSWNDLPLLEKVAYPVVVDGDEVLKKIAGERRWVSLSLLS